MREVTVPLLHPEWMHLRPLADLVKVTGGFESEIFIRRDDYEANAKSILNLLLLADGTSECIVVRADGPDEEEALRAIAELLEKPYDHALD